MEMHCSGGHSLAFGSLKSVNLVGQLTDGFLVTFAQRRLGRLVLHRKQLEILAHLVQLCVALARDLALQRDVTTRHNTVTSCRQSN